MSLQIETNPFQFNQNITVLGSANAYTLSGVHYGDGSHLNNVITSVNGTSNQIVANSNGNNSVTISLPNNLTIPNTINIPGTLNVTGSANYYNTNYLAVSTNIIYFGEGNTGNVLDLGLVSHFTGNLNNGNNNYQHTGIARKAGQNSPGVWTLFSGLTSEPESTPSGINWNDPYLQIDTLAANIQGSLSGTVFGNVSGIALSVVNGVITTASYSDPSWITSLADSKIVGSKFATNTLLQSTSALLTTLTTTNALTSQLVLSTTINSVSGNWNTAYQAVSSIPYTLVNLTSSIKPVRGINTASGNYSAVVGGQCNTASASYNTIVGGLCNLTNLPYDTIGGGCANKICYTNSSYTGSTIAGGQGNCILNNTNQGFIGGGSGNCISGGSQAVISGGIGNKAQYNYSSVLGGNTNYACGGFSSILGGQNNCMVCQAQYNTIAGGRLNNINSQSSVYNCSFYNFIGTAQCAIITGTTCYNVIGSGFKNTASGCYNFIASGAYNATRGYNNTFILGSSLSASQASFTYVNNLSSQGVINLGGILQSTYNGTADSSVLLVGGNTKGGAGYNDFLRVYNPAATSSLWFRTNNASGLELISSDYTRNLFSVSQYGNVNIYGNNAAVSTNYDGISGILQFNANNSQIYDDGNFHIHSRGSGQSVWINSNSGDIRFGQQIPIAGGAVTNSIIFGGSSNSTATGYVNVLGSKTYNLPGPYGYLNNSGAGSINSGGQTGSVAFSIYSAGRMQSAEIDVTSDERVKNVEGTIPLEDAIKFVKNVDGIKYTWKEGFGDEGIKTGFGAQSVHKAGFEHMVSYIANDKVAGKTDEDGWIHPDKTQLTMGYNQAIPYHHEVIKNLLGRIEELEATIAELKK